MNLPRNFSDPKGFWFFSPLVFFSCLSCLTADYTPSPTATFTVTDATDVDRTVILPEGADILRITANWTTVSGSAQSNDFSVDVLGPDGQTGGIVVFDNALDSTAGVNGLEGEIILSAKGTAGTYTLTFSTDRASSSGQFANVDVDAEVILEEIDDSGSLTTGSSTWDRPDENFTADGAGTHYFESVDFTPAYSGTYVIDSEQVKDGFIYLYSSFNSTSPTLNGIVANDDSSRGINFSKMSASLTSGTTYTLVTSSWEETSSSQSTFNYTNTIRYSANINNLPDTWPAFQQLNSLSSFTSDKDNDGILDGFKYAFDSDPDVPENISDFQELAYNSGTDTFSLIFTRDDTKEDIEYIVEANNLLSGTWTALATLTDATANNAPGGDSAKHEVTDATTLTAAGGTRFLRLRINYTGP